MKQMKMLSGLVAVLLMLFPSSMKADLVAGDVVILGINGDNFGGFAWAPLVDLDAGTVISFTDNGVLASGVLQSSESTMSYTAPAGGILAGTILSFTDFITYLDGGGAAYSGTLDDIGDNGDQLLAYTGTSTNPTYLFIAQTNSTLFQVNSNAITQSDHLPTGLVVGETAVAVGAGPGPQSEHDNSVYDYSLLTGSREQILAAVADQSNWNGSGSRIPDLTGGNTAFTVIVAAVPEPSAFLFGSLIAGVMGLTVARRRA